MEIIIKGTEEEVNKFINEIIFPTVEQKQEETRGRYFRITGDFPDFWKHIPQGIKVRKIRGYFPEMYYKKAEEET